MITGSVSKTFRAALTKAGARVFRSDTEIRSIGDILSELGREGMPSVMVEGGAGVINLFLQAQLVDLVVLTTASWMVLLLPHEYHHLIK